MTDTVDHVERVRRVMESLCDAARRPGQNCTDPHDLGLASLDALESERNELRDALREIAELPWGDLVRHPDGDYSVKVNGYKRARAIARRALSQDKEGA